MLISSEHLAQALPPATLWLHYFKDRLTIRDGLYAVLKAHMLLTAQGMLLNLVESGYY